MEDAWAKGKTAQKLASLVPAAFLVCKNSILYVTWDRERGGGASGGEKVSASRWGSGDEIFTNGRVKVWSLISSGTCVRGGGGSQLLVGERRLGGRRWRRSGGRGARFGVSRRCRAREGGGRLPLADLAHEGADLLEVRVVGGHHGGSGATLASVRSGGATVVQDGRTVGVVFL